MRTGGRARHAAAILVCEDNLLMAETLCDFLRDWDFVPVGPVASLEEALRQARESALDGAILDVRLRSRLFLPICPILTARRIPFLFLTGYCELPAITTEFRDAAMIRKPFEPEEMKDALVEMLGSTDDSLPRSTPGLGLRH